MDTNSAYGAPVRRRRRPLLEPILLLSFILCLLIGSGALAALLWLDRTEDVRAAQPLRQTLADAAIKPQLALRQLAGDPPVPLAYQALEAGELETAKSIIVYDPQIRGRERSSLYHQLARQSAQRSLQSESAPLYETMRIIAVLDPALSASERMQLLQGSTEGLIANNQLTNALVSAQQAKRVAAQTPDILPAQRSRYFEALLPLAEQIDDEFFLQQIEEFERNPYVESAGEILPIKLDMLGKPLPPTPEIDAAVATRRQAALQLVQQLMAEPQVLAATQTNDLPTQQFLANTLLAEDTARTIFFNAASANDSTLSLHQQLTLLEERQGWLALKLRIANQGFGLPLVPQWEQEARVIQEELAGVTQNIGPVIESLMNVEPSPKAKAALRVEKLRRLALFAELGLYPGNSAENFTVDLFLAQKEAANQEMPPALPVVFDAEPPIVSYQFSDPMGQ